MSDELYRITANEPHVLKRGDERIDMRRFRSWEFKVDDRIGTWGHGVLRLTYVLVVHIDPQLTARTLAALSDLHEFFEETGVRIEINTY